MKNNNREVLYGLYEDDEVLLSAVKKAKSDHLDIWDVFTPYPVHGLDPALGLAESRIHIAGFIYGAIGTMIAFFGMTWIFTRDWPIIFGGKPYWSVPSFIPITFELTVLLSSIGMVVSFYIVNGLGFGVDNPTLDDRITDDKLCIAFETNGKSEEEVAAMKRFLEESGASEIHSKTI
ncbi:MAG: DUF3341 domain-containing protein [Bacteroidetes bacterium]|nr:MAG: DUF3341 domain-containing protein [Bacteroidota bacterium]